MKLLFHLLYTKFLSTNEVELRPMHTVTQAWKQTSGDPSGWKQTTTRNLNELILPEY